MCVCMRVPMPVRVCGVCVCVCNSQLRSWLGGIAPSGSEPLLTHTCSWCTRPPPSAHYSHTPTPLAHTQRERLNTHTHTFIYTHTHTHTHTHTVTGGTLWITQPFNPFLLA